MFDFSALASAKKQVQQRDQDRLEDYLACYEEALEEFRLFKTLPPDERVESLQIAAEALAEALEYQRQRAEPYLLLAGIFYLLKQLKKAQRYVEIALRLQPDLPGILPLQKLILDELQQAPSETIFRAVPYSAPPRNNNQWKINP